MKMIRFKVASHVRLLMSVSVNFFTDFGRGWHVANVSKVQHDLSVCGIILTSFSIIIIFLPFPLPFLTHSSTLVPSEVAKLCM